jgi:hypothetical protein
MSYSPKPIVIGGTTFDWVGPTTGQGGPELLAGLLVGLVHGKAALLRSKY